jgi:hypothetical protein
VSAILTTDSIVGNPTANYFRRSRSTVFRADHERLVMIEPVIMYLCAGKSDTYPRIGA